MNFATRDRYRHAIEDLARGSRLSELEVARRRSPSEAPRGAHESGAPAGGRAEDPGYYLISKGRGLLEKEIGFRVPLRHRLIRAYVGATPGYLGTIGILTALLLLFPLARQPMRRA